MNKPDHDLGKEGYNRDDRVKKRILVTLLALCMLTSVITAGCIVKVTNTTNTSPTLSWPQSSTATTSSIANRPGTVHMLAVRQVDFNQYEGVVTDVIVAMAPGTGQVFVNTVPLTGYDFQETARTAVNVAAARAHIDPNQYDFGFTIRGSEKIQVVDGPSAGLPMMVAAYSSMTKKLANPNVYSTGEISPDGSVGTVGAVYEKSVAAAQNGAKVILLPNSETTVRIITSNGLEISSRTVNVQEELRRQYDVTVVGVSNIDEALPYYFG
jgi:uncharacterized protein